MPKGYGGMGGGAGRSLVTGEGGVEFTEKVVVPMDVSLFTNLRWYANRWKKSIPEVMREALWEKMENEGVDFKYINPVKKLAANREPKVK